MSHFFEVTPCLKWGVSYQKDFNSELTFFRCEICNVETTDQNGLDMHKQGKKHLKKLKAINWFKTTTYAIQVHLSQAITEGLKLGTRK